MTNALETAIFQARMDAVSSTALALMKNMTKYQCKENLDIAIEAAAIALSASFGGTVEENAEAIEKSIFVK